MGKIKLKIIAAFKIVRNFIMRVIVRLRKFFRKRKLRIYRVIGSNVPSMVGTNFVGIPKRGRQLVMVKRDRGYLTMEPITITKHAKGNRLVVYGKYSRITAKRIR